jgi:hypothetical protein
MGAGHTLITELNCMAQKSRARTTNASMLTDDARGISKQKKAFSCACHAPHLRLLMVWSWRPGCTIVSFWDASWNVWRWCAEGGLPADVTPVNQDIFSMRIVTKMMSDNTIAWKRSERARSKRGIRLDCTECLCESQIVGGRRIPDPARCFIKFEHFFVPDKGRKLGAVFISPWLASWEGCGSAAHVPLPWI